MNILLVDQIVFFLLVAGFGLFHWKHEKVLQGKWITRFPQLAIVAEVVVLVSAVMFCSEGIIWLFIAESAHVDDFAVFSPLLGFIKIIDACFACLLFFPLLFLYLRLSRFKYVLAVLLPVAALVLVFHRQESLKFGNMLGGLNQYPPAFAEALTPKVWISTALYGAGQMVLAVAPFVVGAVSMGRTFSRKRFALVVAITQLVIQLITSIYGFEFNFLVNLIQLVMVTSLAMLIFELPYLRKGVDALIGEAVEEKKKADLSTSVLLLLQYSFMLVFGFCLTGSVFVNREIKVLSEKLMNPKPMYHSPAEVDGLTLMEGTVFTENLELYINDGMVGCDSTLLSVVERGYQHKYLMEILAGVDMTAVNATMESYKDGVTLFEKVGKEADYFGPFTMPITGYQLNTVRLKEVARILSGRAMLQMQEGNSEKALEDIQTIYRFASLLHENEMLVTIMGCSMKRCANIAAWNFMIYHQDDPDELEKLAVMLKNDAKYGRQPFPFDAFLHYVPSAGQTIDLGFLKVEQFYSGFERSYRTLETRWSQYDQLQLTVALYRYHHQHGQWPEALNDLSPEFLKRIPLEPQNGESYLYTFDDKGVTIKRPLDPPSAKNGTAAPKNPPEFPYPVGGELDGAGE